MDSILGGGVCLCSRVYFFNVSLMDLIFFLIFGYCVVFCFIFVIFFGVSFLSIYCLRILDVMYVLGFKILFYCFEYGDENS